MCKTKLKPGGILVRDPRPQPMEACRLGYALRRRWTPVLRQCVAASACTGRLGQRAGSKRLQLVACSVLQQHKYAAARTAHCVAGR